MNTEKLKSVKEKYEALGAQIIQPEVIADNKEWTRLVKEHSSLEPIVSAYDRLVKTQSDIDGALEMLKNEREPEMLELAKEELEEKKAELEKVTEELKILLLPTDPNDEKNVIVEIRGGAGGEEANLFAAELVRMYKMWAAAHRMKVEDIDVNETELGGIKEAVFQISGESVYRVLKYESGAHRVQRVPETETQGRIHTSTATVAVLPEAEDVVVEINEKDLKIDTYRSGGAGGQHVNKTDSAVRMTHLPTGIVVQCQDERSQIKNREKAMRVLKSKLNDYYRSQADAEYSENRRMQVGTGDRSERIRTYNFPQGRVTDHRIGMTIYSIGTFMDGNIDEMLEALRLADQTAKLESSQE
ncbi:peptide chain release factor 1 [Pumilibacter muris]|jgi:peptide chain release factor 1|uniref:peptide chain release factor 1 n=1 Tax=Pumilibacter muris TaxID=2941510 RepID=UPI00203AF27F|nr:peptide chain release factor 1 [Pumilibacter muris]